MKSASTTRAEVINAFIARYPHTPRGAKPVRRPDREVWAKPGE
ncbi:hypothetical protein [Streptacidiphilus jiangxiensis]|uniref:Uncharacterized protein n=1 Tax=Streptacidiphilus jiangxiensis TaxID=235985 RepID=A0A1H7X8R3_STRJI|nr:hypothetical protein [Streptacidiphilus jiangxiensis]SEM29577.1 hypothetical protein SAMN05414137_12310 [Streptacidiphilus jiangxiensis]